MKLEIGHVVEVEGKEGVVVYVTNIGDSNYVLVSYEEGNIIDYKVFEVKYEDNNLYLAEEKNKELVSDILVEFTKDNTILKED